MLPRLFNFFFFLTLKFISLGSFLLAYVFRLDFWSLVLLFFWFVFWGWSGRSMSFFLGEYGRLPPCFSS